MDWIDYNRFPYNIQQVTPRSLHFLKAILTITTQQSRIFKRDVKSKTKPINLFNPIPQETYANNSDFEANKFSPQHVWEN